MVKNLPVNEGDEGSTPGLGRSPGEGNGNLAPGIPRTEEAEELHSMRSQKST